MRYTIITPTLLRPALTRLCDSIDTQTYVGWQHLVLVDDRRQEERHPVLAAIRHPQRQVVFRRREQSATWDHVNGSRHDAWNQATGDYLLYIDDDNYLADPDVLQTLCCITDPVGLFPLLYDGMWASPEPIVVPGSDSNGLIVRRDIGQYPTAGGRRADGQFIVALTKAHPFQVFRDRALVVYEREHFGV